MLSPLPHTAVKTDDGFQTCGTSHPSLLPEESSQRRKEVGIAGCTWVSWHFALAVVSWCYLSDEIHDLHPLSRKLLRCGRLAESRHELRCCSLWSFPPVEVRNQAAGNKKQNLPCSELLGFILFTEQTPVSMVFKCLTPFIAAFMCMGLHPQAAQLCAGAQMSK